MLLPLKHADAPKGGCGQGLIIRQSLLKTCGLYSAITRVVIDQPKHYQLSFWDAMIVQAANRAGLPLLYSEDLNHDQRYGTVRVENPFLATRTLDE